VREETLQLLVKFGENGKGLIMKLLKDPSAEIRSKASVNLAKVAKGQAVKPLMEIILSEDFYKRNYEEKVSFSKPLGRRGRKKQSHSCNRLPKSGFGSKRLNGRRCGFAR
jgi:HEAT repeat protein